MRIQTLALDERITVLPVPSNLEAARYIARLAHHEARPAQSRTSALTTGRKSHQQTPTQQILATLRTFPSVGDKKAVELTGKFASIDELANAAEHTVSEVIGKAGAKRVIAFLDGPLRNNGAGQAV
ncbi:hypothetical protein HKX48_003584 [Thoreauomyces humboldtii]|nr:hypothetical protein HKX48_003584 [Thoreauomyces humboldtii]